ncbi:MAG: hypothetical protein PUF12_00670, partial [Thermoflexaceae bacterium]|nr:hypothetical protein [Thermoflexaceae bacterium]
MEDNNSMGCLKIEGKFDKALNHISGNLNMQNFLGNNLMVSLYKIIHPEDEAKVQLMLEKCVEGGYFRDLIRIKNAKDEYESYILKVDFDKEMQLYNIGLVNAEEVD